MEDLLTKGIVSNLLDDKGPVHDVQLYNDTDQNIFSKMSGVMTNERQENLADPELIRDLLKLTISPNELSLYFKNKLNELTVDLWLYFAKTLLTISCPAQYEYSYELHKIHVTKKPSWFIKTLIEYFTKQVKLVAENSGVMFADSTGVGV